MVKTKKKIVVFTETSGLFSVELVAKTKKKKMKRSSPKIQKIRWESFRHFIAAYLSLKKGKVAGRVKCLSGPHPAHGPLIADPCIKQSILTIGGQVNAKR